MVRPIDQLSVKKLTPAQLAEANASYRKKKITESNLRREKRRLEKEQAKSRQTITKPEEKP